VSANTLFPVVDQTVCVHSRLIEAGCRSCADACPRDALSPGAAGGYEPDPDACTGCGVCVAACGEEAIRLPLPARDQALRTDGARLTLVCDRHTAAKGDDALPCLHCFGLDDLARAWAASLRRIEIATGDCDACDTCPPDRLEQQIARFNTLARSRGLAQITHHTAGPKALERWRAEKTRETTPHQGRRAFLRALATPVLPEEPKLQNASTLVTFLERTSPDTTPLYPFSPIIDPTLCSACDACTLVCPHSALILINDENGKTAYGTDNSACTGCGLCVDICDEDAISVATMTGPGPDLPLTRFRCNACGNWQHTLDHTPPQDGYCRICRTSDSRRNLFVTLP